MKNKGIGKRVAFIFGIAILMSMFTIGSCSAVTSTLKDNYSPKETMVFQVYGNILEPISMEQVEFKRVNVNVPLQYGMEVIGGKYFIWAIAPENPGNYTFRIKDVTSTVNGKAEESDFEKQFSVSGEMKQYYITPGVISTGEDFEIKAFVNGDEKIQVSVGSPINQAVVLEPGENKLKFGIESFSGTQFTSLNIGEYSVPAYIKGKGSVPSNSTEEEIILPIRILVIPSQIESIVYRGNAPGGYQFFIRNTGTESAENAYLDYDRRLISITPDEKISVKPNATAFYNISIKSNVNRSIATTIYFRSGSYSAPLLVNINFTDDASKAATTYTNVPSSSDGKTSYKCFELMGTICTADQTCTGTVISSSDGNCCKGACVVQNNDSEGGYAWIGYLIAGIVILGGVYLWIRFKKTKTDGNSIFQKNVSLAEKK